jgi:LacI family transcriptional regulator
MPVRLKDIAQELGVTTVTVSKVLRGSSDVGDVTRARVLQRMKELNYQPNMLARALTSGQSLAVGLVVPDLVHPFFAELAKSLGGTLRQNGFALMLASSEEDPEIERNEIRTMLHRGMDAIVVASCQPYSITRPLLDSTGTPLVLLDRRFRSLKANFVGCNDVTAGELATRHLLAIGRTRIAHIAGSNTSPSIDRLHGYQKALSKAGVHLPKNYVVTQERFEEAGDTAGYQAMQELLSRRVRPDAVFCYNDLTAVGAMQAAMDAGVLIPQEVAFVGCGNLRYAPYLKVPLTSIDQATTRMGAMVGELAISVARTPRQPPQVKLLEPTLVVRQSSVAS